MNTEAKTIAMLRQALTKWVMYDELLRSLPGEGPLYGRQLLDVDAAYDACVAATTDALAASRKEQQS